MLKSVSIAGAGIGGLTAALALVRRGHSVDVYEQAPQFGEVGAGLQLSPNTMRVLHALDLGPAIRRIAFEPQFAAIRHYRTGATYFAPRLGSACERRYGAPYLHVHRADLHAILTDAAARAGVALHLNTYVKGYEVRGDRARLLIDGAALPFADLVIGADGLKSAIRDQMLGEENPRFTGHVAWRGTVATTRLTAGLVKPGATVWIGPRRHVVTYYVRGGDILNFAAFEERYDQGRETWTRPGDLRTLNDAFGNWHPEVSEVVRALDTAFIWPLFDREPLSRWSDGPVAWLGDACHPTLPYMAQGAALAIEDAWVLAAFASRQGSAEAVRAYERERKARTTMMQSVARANGRTFHMTGGYQDRLRLASLCIASLLPRDLQLRPLDKIYGYDATLIAD